MSDPTALQDDSPLSLLRRYRETRLALEAACEPLTPEDMQVQSMPDASPAKWHLAHTTWFWETFVLSDPAMGGCEPFHPAFNYLFNSYYEAAGQRHPRPQRGLLTRPSVAEVLAYRKHVDTVLSQRLPRLASADWQRLRPIVELGINHEQQHLELFFTDIKHAFGLNPLRPVYRELPSSPSTPPPPPRWLEFDAGVRRIGHVGPGFAFDNEGPSHRVFLEPFAIASRLVTCGEYLAFMADGGYERADLWLSDGWATRREHGWEAPLYWERHDNGWNVFTLSGLRPLNEAEPVCHVSFYEADACARWAGARLPTEAEWEVACAAAPVEGNLLESSRLHPTPRTGDGQSIAQAFGDVWEWTQSPYTPYPGYRPPAGPPGESVGNRLVLDSPNIKVAGFSGLSEYNAKFFFGGIVLRGGSCVTPQSHIRATYRNFFSPTARWQFTGIRLARDLSPG